MSGSQRIFWLGMHKILVQTELPRLRMLGYEVFHPPYLSSVQDQSANLDWDANQTTTLPPEVFEKLSNYNFFYNAVSAEIAELLNTYFDAVLVTISPAWLAEILKVYHGKVIYRVYGQHFMISEELAANKLIHNIVSRDNFWFVPHAAEAVKDEESWLREREMVVPYCLPPDVFEYTDTWAAEPLRWSKIAVTCPNIKNPYFHAHYKYLQTNFGESFYRYYGVQLSKINDPRVVGTLPRKDLLASFQKSAGYLYTYTDERVCYLPPVEMMVLGGPVLFLKGSLLDHYNQDDAPGRCVTVDEAHTKSRLLIKNDQAFIADVVTSQHEVRARYTPADVWPIFDAAFQKILGETNKAPAWLAVDAKKPEKQTKRIYIFHHFPGHPVVQHGGHYAAYDGIPRVVRQVAMILAEQPDVEICVTARADQVASMNGYFRTEHFRDRVRVLCINPEDVMLDPPVDNSMAYIKRKMIIAWRRCKKIPRKIAKLIIPYRHRPYIKKAATKLYELVQRIRLNGLLNNELWHISHINNDKNCAAVFIPHYYLFPDALKLRKKPILYLPDYMPHFFHDTGEFVLNEGVHTRIGRMLVKKAETIFCNSNFTKSYLPDCRLKVPSEKIHVSYLPCLNTGTKANSTKLSGIDKRLEEKPYIFYPTRPRPNKNLSLLLSVFDQLVAEGQDVNLVLTTPIDCDEKATKIFRSMQHQERVIFLDAVTDDMLSSLYRRAAVLCFTSLAEGNFPPQIHEALLYGTPVVAGRLGFITERIPVGIKDALILCEPNNEREFVDGCKRALTEKELILEKQQQLLREMEKEDIDTRFRNTVLEIFNLA